MSTITALEQLHQEAFDRKVEIDRHYFQATDKSRCFKDGDYELVVLNMSSIDSQAKEYVVLAEELSHLETSALYHITNNFNTRISRQNRQKAEAKAIQHMINKILPTSKIQSCLDKHLLSSCEIAEELCVTTEWVERAIDYHRSRGVVFSFDNTDNCA